MKRREFFLASGGVVAGAAVGVAGSRVGSGLATEGQLIALASSKGLSGDEARGALKTAVPPGKYDPYYMFPTGEDTAQDKMDRVKIDDLKLRAGISEIRLERRAGLRKSLDAQMPEVEKAVEKYALAKYYDQAYNLILSGRARKAFDLTQEPDSVRDRYGRSTFGQSASSSSW